MHPVINSLWKRESRGIDLEAWIEEIEENISIEEYGLISKQDLEYYFDKYKFYKANDFFSEIDTHQRLRTGVTPEEIKAGVANLDNVCFEVTEECSLNCSYCTYGDLYTSKRGASTHVPQKLDIDLAKKFLAYLAELRNSDLNRWVQKKILIAFYGGEPLLNMDFIKEIVRFSTENQDHHKTEISFGMTTNGTELHKYMDFLVKHDFTLTISLDGEEKNNQHRVFHNGKSSFSKVVGNIKLLKARYPKYFKKKVLFNTVLHNKNSIAEIHNFFKTNFNKVPSFSEVAPFWINPSKEEELKSISKSSYRDLKETDNIREIREDMFSKLPPIKDLTFFLYRYSPYIYRSYRDFLIGKKGQGTAPPHTGTCIPLGKKLFVSATGKLLPCENVGHDNFLDYIDGDKIEIDFQRVADKYNGYLNKLIQCRECLVSTKCEQCMYNIASPHSLMDCSYFENRTGILDFFSAKLSSFENNPGLYQTIMRKTRYV